MGLGSLETYISSSKLKGEHRSKKLEKMRAAAPTAISTFPIKIWKNNMRHHEG